LQLKSAIL